MSKTKKKNKLSPKSGPPIFDVNAASDKNAGIFGLPFTRDQSRVIYLPVPWEATTSYGKGTADGPKAILRASHQLDLYDPEVLRPYACGLFLEKENAQLRKWASQAKNLAASARNGNKAALKKVNDLGNLMNAWVKEEIKKIYLEDKIPALIGGDHSTPFGAFEAAADEGSFGILHFDAHSDTRSAYEGFTWSHASIMHNALTRLPQIKKIVQVGIRDFCEQEVDFIRSQGDRMRVFYDHELKISKEAGVSWTQTAHEIVSALPQRIWISFDIDGLDPRYCPHTGTPVPGGLEFHEANAVLRACASAGKKIIGFDLNEVAPSPKGKSDEWDANVGMRLLYKLTAWTLVSQGLAKRLS